MRANIFEADQPVAEALYEYFAVGNAPCYPIVVARHPLGRPEQGPAFFADQTLLGVVERGIGKGAARQQSWPVRGVAHG